MYNNCREGQTDVGVQAKKPMWHVTGYHQRIGEKSAKRRKFY